MPQAGPLLSPDVLARRSSLPRKPDPVTLTGSTIELLPLDLGRDVEALHAVSDGRPVRWGERSVGRYDPDEVVWRFMPDGPFASAEELGGYLAALADAPNGLCLCVRDARSGQQLGAVNLQTNMPEHLKIELGNIWYSPVAQAAGVNHEAVGLLLEHVFALGYRRAEWKCDARNVRSRRAAERLGFRFEGIQDAHYVVKGRNRDTAWFRMLDDEWPAIRPRFTHGA
jgi:RimJ/RimL family protein N-acetyltransferase